jgi:hypothetical protein
MKNIELENNKLYSELAKLEEILTILVLEKTDNKYILPIEDKINKVKEVLHSVSPK